MAVTDARREARTVLDRIARHTISTDPRDHAAGRLALRILAALEGVH